MKGTTTAQATDTTSTATSIASASTASTVASACHQLQQASTHHQGKRQESILNIIQPKSGYHPKTQCNQHGLDNTELCEQPTQHIEQGTVHKNPAISSKPLTTRDNQQAAHSNQQAKSNT